MAPYGAPNGANAVATLVQLSQETYKHRSAFRTLTATMIITLPA